MSVTPTDIVIDGVTIPTLTLAAGSTGGLGVAASIDPVNDYLAIYQNSSTSTLGINRNTVLGLSSAPVGLTDTQTLTNKTLTSPTIAGPVLSGTVGGTYTLGGTPTFPASVATLTGAQVLTNKTLTSPTINSPTITNATLSSDTITGYSVSNSGTIYGGISVATGNVSMSGTLAVTGAGTFASTLKVQSNPVWQYLGSATSSTDFTTTSGTASQITGLSSTVTVPSGYTKVRVTVILPQQYNSGSNVNELYLYRGTVPSGTNVPAIFSSSTAETSGNVLTGIWLDTPGAGSVTYNAGFAVSAGTGHTNGAGEICTILVECC